MRNLTEDELKQLRDLANEIEELSAEMNLLCAKLRRACDATPGMKIDPITGEWITNK